MIKTKSDMNLLCMKSLNTLTDYETRLILFNYIYYRTGKEEHDIFKANITNMANYAINLHKAYRYFVNI